MAIAGAVINHSKEDLRPTVYASCGAMSIACVPKTRGGGALCSDDEGEKPDSIISSVGYYGVIHATNGTSTQCYVPYCFTNI